MLHSGFRIVPSTVMAAVGVFIASLTAPTVAAQQRTVTDVSLTSWTTDVLTGTVGGIWTGDDIPTDGNIALVLGPTGVPQPSDAYLQAAYNLYLNPSGLYTGTESDVYSLYTPEESGNTLNGLTADEADLNNAMMPLLANGNHITLFGYSQSTAAISHWLVENPEYTDQVNFVMVGNSASPHGLLANIYESLPAWMQTILNDNLTAWGLNGVLGMPDAPSPYITPDNYDGAVYTLMSGGAGSSAMDGYASWSPDSFTNGDWWNQLSGMFSTHMYYLGMTPQDIDAAMADPSETIGNVAYYDLDPGQSPLELFIQSAAGAGWLPEWLADSLLSIG